MSTHASAEVLSAYLDRQLVEPKARQLEEHIESCQQCHVKLEGLRKVVTNLQNLEQLAAPLSLEQTVARRITLSDRSPSLLDRFEEGMSIFNRQSPMLSMFGVVIALALFIYLFSYTLHLRETATTPVIFEDPPAADGAAPRAEGSARRTEGAPTEQLVAADRRLLWSGDGLWVEEGVSAAAVSRTVTFDSDDGRALLAAHPDLAGLADLDRSVVIEVGGEVIRLK